MGIKAFFKDLFSLSGDTASQEKIYSRIVDGSKIHGSNMCILMLAIFIASIGLNMNSTAVIIGAMLISPLMSSILSAAYGTASADMHLFKKSIVGLGIQVLICLVTSMLYFIVSPISTSTSELLARTQPTIWDVLIALFGGTAGIIGITRKEKSNVIPGVAIATALMPPLCTCGYGIATRQWNFLLGAGYLFLVNTYFIFLSSTVILLILKVPMKKTISQQLYKKVKKVLIRNTIIMIIPSIIVAYGMVQNANADKDQVIGFEKFLVNTESLENQMKILFPQIKDIEISNSENSNKQIVNIFVSEKIEEYDAKRLEAWLEEIYQTNCEVYQNSYK